MQSKLLLVAALAFVSPFAVSAAHAAGDPDDVFMGQVSRLLTCQDWSSDEPVRHEGGRIFWDSFAIEKRTSGTHSFIAVHSFIPTLSFGQDMGSISRVERVGPSVAFCWNEDPSGAHWLYVNKDTQYAADEQVYFKGGYSGPYEPHRLTYAQCRAIGNDPERAFQIASEIIANNRREARLRDEEDRCFSILGRRVYCLPEHGRPNHCLDQPVPSFR